MLRNCENMVLISSTPNQWSQNNSSHIDDPKSSSFNNNNMASLAAATMDHQKVAVISQQQQQDQQQQQQQKQQQNQEPLRCPRCDSANTKFCYYNNYSLTQPRHFCKACKRYWTRGGTLRNVPVGGGCRKNKRVKRPPNNANNIHHTSSSTTSLTHNNSGGLEVNSAPAAAGAAHAHAHGHGQGGLSSLSHHPHGGSHIHDLLSSGSNHVNHPLFYGLPTNHSSNSDMNFPFSRYDLQNPPQINGLGLGFSSGLVQNMNIMNIHNNNNNNNNNNSLPQNTKQIFQDLISSNPLLSNYNSTTTTSTAAAATTTANSTTTTPSLSSLLAQMKGGHNNTHNFQTLLPSYENDLQMKGNGHDGMSMKGIKMEFEGQNRSSIDHHHWNNNTTNNNTQNHMDQNISSSSDPSSILWGNSGANLNAWLDPSNNLGSSVPSLI